MGSLHQDSTSVRKEIRSDMFEIIIYLLHITSLCGIIFSVVYFVGYWVSANYYTNFSQKFKEVFGLYCRVAYLVPTVLVLPGLVVIGWKATLLFIPVFGTITLGAMIGLLSYHLYWGFHKSRKYFADKRNVKL